MNVEQTQSDSERFSDPSECCWFYVQRSNVLMVLSVCAFKTLLTFD